MFYCSSAVHCVFCALGWFSQGVWRGFYSRSMEWREMLLILAAAKHDVYSSNHLIVAWLSLDAPVVLGRYDIFEPCGSTEAT